ncbi:non-ribosomal peptide synthetase [Actinoplanes couchii]|uniref:Carrier domain-containing protein n=1 Tax=Actinoplanes couchii TaxID=403638 RepID=A0ABQ3XSK0_9ACTN|nr:non-ribosomal peptide synthetase [Actinoplanes couchii]MDR6315973.1 amino acid adenylation domain-containing protein [Actinoplanes couchii]GID61491.1 hypothetical protein Aco03nite_098950 [Actinoplanes couchii]
MTYDVGDVQEIQALTPLQEGILFHGLLDDDDSIYVAQYRWTVRGEFDMDLFEKAWQIVIQRHDALRVSFEWEGIDQPVQIVWRRVGFAVDRRDLTGLPEDDQRKAIDAYAQEDLDRRYDLATAPLYRVTAFHTTEGTHVVWSFHQLLMDGWSLQTVYGELSRVYAALLTGREPDLPEPVQYSAYLAWLQGSEPDGADRFWRDALAGYEPAPLFGDGRTARWHTDGSRKLAVDAAGFQRIRSFAAAQRITVNTVVSGAWALLVALYSGTRDVVFGLSAAERPAELAGADRIVGVMLNSVPIRAEVRRGQTVGDWLRSLQAHQAEAREYGRAPLTDIHRWSGLATDASLFETMLAFENYPLAEATAAPVVEVGAVDYRTRVNYPLTLIAEFDQTLDLKINYDTRRFDEPTVDQLSRHLLAILDALVAEWDKPVAGLDVLTGADRRLLVEEWNATGADLGPDATLGELFERQAARSSGEVAVVCGTDRLTYAELNERANRLARHLRTLGAAPETVVAISLDRGVESVIAMLGVLKAGAAYAPIDPSYPLSRKAFMLADTRAAMVLTAEAEARELPEHDVPVVRIDADWPLIAEQEGGNLPSSARPGNLAYLIYTSGSTGIPKGVEITHRSVANYLRWWAGIIDGQGDGGVSHYSLAFDTTVRDTFCPLLAGQRLHILPAHEKSVIQAEPFLAEGERLSYLKMTPSELAAEERLTADQVADLTGILLVGGEAVLRSGLLAELAESPRVRLANHYGPTEGSIGTTFNWIDGAEQATGVLPIGRPLPNTTAYVLDDRARLLPVGVPGELYLGGVGVGRGYRGRAGLTAQKFVPDPFGAPGARLYRTGDLVRYRPDHNLEFLGRIDHQVKIRGHRVELGEIEVALSRHDGVSRAAVIVREDIPGDRRLVGYVVPADDSVDVPGLRGYLAESLPGYMVPSLIVAVDEIPMLASRKVDRSRLPVPVITRADEGYVAPSGPVQEVIAGIWADLLSADRIGAADDFFALGGHSLLVTRVMSRVREAFGVEVPFGALFDTPTVAGLAQVVSGMLAGGATAVLPPVVAVDRDQQLPLSFPQQRLWFLDQLIPGNPFYNLPAAYRLLGPLDVEALHRTVTAIVHRHEVLRTVFPAPSGGRPVQVVLPAGEVPMPVIEVAGETAEERLAEATRISSEEAARVFDLSAGPVFRATLLRISPTDHVFVMVIHHMVGDGWSSSLLAKELGAFYGAYATGSDPGLPPLPVQYADYAVWQREWLTETVIDAQLAYWRGKLTGMPAVLELPTDRLRPAVSTYEGSTRFFTLPRSVVDGLRAVAREHRATLYMVLLAAFKALLVRYTGQTDVVIGAPVANRRSAVLEDLVGFFINTLVLRTDCSGDPSFSELVERVRETTLGAYAHQDIPFERLVTALAPPRDLSRNPLVQVGFQLQNMPLGLLEMAELQSSFFMTGKLTTHLDVEVYLTEVPLDVEVPAEMLDILPPGAGDDLSGGLYGRVVYSTDLFDETTLDRMVAHFRRILDVVAASPGIRASEIDMLSDAERYRLTREWSTGPAVPDLSADTTVARMIERRAAETPQAIAVACGDDRLTYAKLNGRANRLAGYLRSIGAGPEKAVAVLLPRGVDAVVALLATFKSGGVYVPLDPSYPSPRIAYMLADTGAVALVTDDELAAGLPAHTARVVRTGVDLSAFSPADLPQLGGADNLAYVIYTSGSTGLPKGVEVPHRGLVSLVRYQADLFEISPDTRSSNAFGPAFDAALSATVLPLTQGGTLYIQPPDTYRYGAELARHIDANEVTALHLPVSVLKSLPESDLPSLRSIGTGAESVTPQVVRRWADRLRMYNCYGPTETTVVSVMGRCRPEMANGRTIPIGRPVAGTTVYVLDERMRLVPQGVPGELWIGGIGVTRGYRNSPGRTALSFRPDPYGTAPGARLYRTGDLVRYLADGRLEYLSRVDQQVKVRGHRIELGEVEAALARHPDVVDAVASVDENGPGGARLVAHVVTRDDTAELAEIRPFLRDALPGYMVPSVIVSIDAVPLLPSGKADRAALPPVEGIRPELAAGYVAPEGPLQLALADIWAGTLGLSGVGVNDDFFALGGHSMLIIQIIWQIKQRLGIELSFADIFESPTIADLSARIAELQAEDDNQ